MACGLLKIPFQSQVLSYDDEQTPEKLIGKKMLPIMEFAENDLQNESLDIIERLDVKDRLGLKKLRAQGHQLTNLEKLLNQYGENIHSLAMPYWAYSKEFNTSAREYFIKKKEKKRGPFADLAKKRELFESNVNKDICSLEKNLTPYYNSEIISIMDIMLASHFWGLYVVPEYRHPQFFHDYLQRVKNECGFNYHEDFWS